MRAHRTRSKTRQAKAGDPLELKKKLVALKRANTECQKKLKDAEAESARLKKRERLGIPWRDPGDAIKMSVCVGKADASKPFRAWNQDGSDWALGDSPLEAVGALVQQVAMHRPVLVMSLEFE